jgi:hypothetical protein
MYGRPAPKIAEAGLPYINAYSLDELGLA